MPYITSSIMHSWKENSLEIDIVKKFGKYCGFQDFISDFREWSKFWSFWVVRKNSLKISNVQNIDVFYIVLKHVIRKFLILIFFVKYLNFAIS